jgi:hypothetical protein
LALEDDLDFDESFRGQLATVMNYLVQDDTDIDVVYIGTVDEDGIAEGVNTKEMFMSNASRPSGLCTI